MGLQGYPARQLEDALCTLWEMVECRLSKEETDRLRDGESVRSTTSAIFDELWNYGRGGPVGLGLGRVGGHATGG